MLIGALVRVFTAGKPVLPVIAYVDVFLLFFTAGVFFPSPFAQVSFVGSFTYVRFSQLGDLNTTMFLNIFPQRLLTAFTVNIEQLFTPRGCPEGQ
jgi:hypothetical protein